MTEELVEGNSCVARRQKDPTADAQDRGYEHILDARQPALWSASTWSNTRVGKGKEKRNGKGSGGEGNWRRGEGRRRKGEK